SPGVEGQKETRRLFGAEQTLVEHAVPVDVFVGADGPSASVDLETEHRLDTRVEAELADGLAQKTRLVPKRDVDRVLARRAGDAPGDGDRRDQRPQRELHGSTRNAQRSLRDR